MGSNPKIARMSSSESLASTVEEIAWKTIAISKLSGRWMRNTIYASSKKNVRALKLIWGKVSYCTSLCRIMNGYKPGGEAVGGDI